MELKNTWYEYNDENTEATEKMDLQRFKGRFEIVLDIVKVNTQLTIGE